MREIKVEDALQYLDQVKVEFGDRPHIYNEFLGIMKDYKSKKIDTPGVIQRVSSLFHGNKRLLLGLNTFLPEEYKIDLPMDGANQCVVFRAPGQHGVTQVLGPTSMQAQPSSKPQARVASAPVTAQQPEVHVAGPQPVPSAVTSATMQPHPPQRHTQHAQHQPVAPQPVPSAVTSATMQPHPPQRHTQHAQHQPVAPQAARAGQPQPQNAPISQGATPMDVDQTSATAGFT